MNEQNDEKKIDKLNDVLVTNSVNSNAITPVLH